MNLDELKQYVLSNSKEYILETKKILQSPKVPDIPKMKKPTFAKKDVNKLPKEPKAPKVPKTLKINEEENENCSPVENACTPEKIKTLAEEMKKINKKIDLRNPLINPEMFDIILENKSDNRWQKLYNYEIPKDDLR